MKNYLAFCLSLLFWSTAYSQADTLSLARETAYAGDFDEADALLSRYSLSHPDLEVLRLHAQVLYWKKDFARSEAKYQRALEAYPQAHFLHLEYGRMLWERGLIFPAQDQLLAYLEGDSLHQEANLLQAYVEYWTGRLSQARERINRLLASDPSYNPAKGLLNELNAVSSPWLNLRGGMYSDDQPLSSIRMEAEVGKYAAWWLTPVFRFRYMRFSGPKAIHPLFQVEVRDQIDLVRTKTRLNVYAGMLAPLYGQAATLGIGGLTLSQSLGASLFLDIGLEKRPYLFTIPSVQDPFTEQFAQLALRFEKGDEWLGKAALERQRFPDGNTVQTAYAWALAPVLNRWKVKVQAGYAFSYGHAPENRFQTDGTYDPYFTPRHQVVHALLGLVQYQIGEHWHVSVRGSAGVWANADIPYFYPSGDPVDPEAYVKDYVRDAYFPLEISGEVRRGIGEQSALSLAYTYQQLLFYTQHFAGIQYKRQFSR